MMIKKIFIDSLKALRYIPEEQILAILKSVILKKLKAGQNYILEGEIPNEFAFNSSGLLRYYYIDNEGNEFTKGFFSERNYICSYSAMIQNRGSYFTIEALEYSELVCIRFSDFKSLLKSHPCWNTFLISLLEKGYCTKEMREREFLLFDAETRYQSFLNSFPGLEKRVKQHHIASYLGITNVALSRIRRKMGLINIG